MSEPSEYRLVKPFNIFTAGAIGGLAVVLGLGGVGSLVLPEIEQYFLNKSSTNPPLKIRGGAMTFRSNVQFGKDGSYSCVQLTPSSIKLIDVGSLKSGKAIPDVNIPSIEVPWQMDLYGRDGSGKNESSNGIRIRTTQTCVVTTASATSSSAAGVSFIPESADSTFYPNNDGASLDEDNVTRRKRYQDESCTATSLNSDEDSCEHIYSIYINTAFKNTTADVKADPAYFLRCKNGECVIKIGDS